MEFHILLKFLKIKLFKKKISNLIGIAQAGGKLDEKLQKKIVNYSIKNNNKFYVMYGQAEATTRISYVPHNKIKKKIRKYWNSN